MTERRGRKRAPSSFEEALTEFEGLVERMEQGDLSLEDSVGAYQRGMELHKYCEKVLADAERRIEVLAGPPEDVGAGGAGDDDEEPAPGETPLLPEDNDASASRDDEEEIPF